MKYENFDQAKYLVGEIKELKGHIDALETEGLTVKICNKNGYSLFDINSYQSAAINDIGLNCIKRLKEHFEEKVINLEKELEML